MDTQTRHALKQDKFAKAAVTSASWLSEHRSSALRWVIAGAVVLAIVIGGAIVYGMKDGAAESALGAALDIYNTPLAQPGAPPQAGTYSKASDRAKAANDKFVAIAQQYGWLPLASKAHYFAGATYEDLGQNAQAETELKAAAGAWDHNLANLAKIALAGLYHKTSRDAQAIDLYNAVVAKPSDTVPATAAQLDLAQLYADSGKQDQARALWAKVKDADKDGAAGSMAAEKLAAKQ